ncbi:iron complex transport system permease protein [Deinobacterium chartae]|uniref:Iron complex transport system permease protein n=1 Tax=Deinobacterium chartae TaxID=521158 RepID=A0A841I868_9DEIO|nr:iron ABC transporter permease [Deinobacterium chartae]MBB6100022.1 iron complex transport system permease protein [Deinobacterium chartae]
MTAAPASTVPAAARRVRLAGWLLPALLLLALTLSVMLGPVALEPGTVWGVVLHRLGLLERGDWTAAQEGIVWSLRLPRALLAAVVGAGLAVAGCVMQALVRNPLADPYLLGVSSGASAGAVLALSGGALLTLGAYRVPLFAFAGALLSLGVVFALARSGGSLTPTRLVLSGVAVAYLFSGLTSLLTLTAPDRELARSALAWTLGSLAGTRWQDLGLPALTVALCTVGLLGQARVLNALAFGDETATTLGVPVRVLRRALLAGVSLLAAVTVSVSGAVGFVGLMLPHMLRLLVGADHRRVLPLSALGGALFLVLVDLLARTAFAPTELPLGVITSLLGAPFFLWLLSAREGRA